MTYCNRHVKFNEINSSEIYRINYKGFGLTLLVGAYYIDYYFYYHQHYYYYYYSYSLWCGLEG